MLEDKAYLNGKGIENTNGNIIDFSYMNKITRNIALIEIKTPTTQLMKRTEYRKNVFANSTELSGAIIQTLKYRDNLLKGFYLNHYQSETKYEALNPKCILIIGTLDELSTSERESFELLRNELRHIEIITFDELFEKVQLIINLFHNENNALK